MFTIYLLQISSCLDMHIVVADNSFILFRKQFSSISFIQPPKKNNKKMHIKKFKFHQATRI